MDEKVRQRIQLDCLYEMFRDRIEENVIYIVHSENDGKIDTTIDQLMSISLCSFTGHHFEPVNKPLAESTKATDNIETTSNDKKLLQHSTSKRTNNEEDNNEDSETVDEASLTVEQRIEKLQKSINDLLLEKKNSHEKASQYLSKKMFPVTSYYSELASQYRKMIESKTNQMVDLLLQKSQDSNCIDLHGLNPIQARLVVSELIRIRQEKLAIDKQGHASIDVITGWGKHSVTQGQHRVRPTIVSLLRDLGIEFAYINKGALRVTLRRCKF